MAKKAALAPADKVALYEAVIAAIPGVERKGATMPYTSVNGHMFSFLNKDGQMGLRLAAGDREAFLERHDTVLCEEYGRVMKEYVAIPDGLLSDTAKLKPYVEASFAYVSALKPKPTKRKPKA
ncbi:hypothetical protein [Bauldia sp.]|uniref:hypothetical protein n=1 Tax=Bauldia sp. TaxID=2575872 RepID=UPI003BA8CE4F